LHKTPERLFILNSFVVKKITVMAVILIIETSTEVCSVALSKDCQIIDLIESREGQNHARLVAVFIERLLKRNAVKLNDLVAVAVSKGPGSYTGLRIGVSTAKGLCYASGLPLIAIGTLESMATHVILNQSKYDIPENKHSLFCPMIDARRMEVYSMVLDEQVNILKPVSANIIDESFLYNELIKNQVVFFGNGSAKCKKLIDSVNAIFIDHIEASAQYMSELVWHAYNKNQFEDVAYFEPFYLKEFIAIVSKKNMLR
jgi:tRNA threonylcarbamoyladenosine biosynthesis protein TsaB